MVKITNAGFEGGTSPGFYNWTSGDVSTSIGTSKGPILMTWGPVTFDVFPLNIHEYDHATATDWAEKEIAGAPIYREWVGEDDEIIQVRGRIFPHHKIGGLPQIEFFESCRRTGIAQQMVRSDGWVFGWFVCERLMRVHEHIAEDGVGSVVSFEGAFARVPVPERDGYFPGMYRVFQTG